MAAVTCCSRTLNSSAMRRLIGFIDSPGRKAFGCPSAPTTAGTPSSRATMAAWQVRPPRLVTLPNDGVGLARMEFIVSEHIGIHPMALACPERVASKTDRAAITRLVRNYARPVRRWVLKFGPAIARRLRQRRPRPSDRWHLDEMVVRIAGERMYLWQAVDHEGEVLDMLVQPRRDIRAASAARQIR